MEPQEKPVSFFRFEDLRVFTKATDYSAWLIKNLDEPGNEAQRTLVNTFCRSSYDISLNIAEGSSRNKSHFEHYLKIAKTAIRECIAYTTVARNVGLLDERRHDQSREYLMELTRMIGALIISLQRGVRRRDDGDMPADDGGSLLDDGDIDTAF